MKTKTLNNHIEHIINGYKQQAPLYQQILEVTQKVEFFLSAGDVDGVNAVLERRAQIIANLEDLIGSTKAHIDSVKEMLHLKEFKLERVEDLVFPKLREELKAQQELIDSTITKILDLDKQNEIKMRVLQSEAATEVGKIRKHFELQRAYLNRPQKFPNPFFVDKTR